MTLQEICEHERAGMATRREFGYAQHDDHVWRWLNHELKVWGDMHPLKVREAPGHGEVITFDGQKWVTSPAATASEP